MDVRIFAAATALLLSGCLRTDAQVPPRAEARTPAPAVQPAEPASRAAQPNEAPPRETSRAEEVMQAISRAYPGRVGAAQLVDGDWSVVLDGVRYFYAEARLLPESLRGKAAEYDPQPFYPYPKSLSDWKAPDEAEVASFRAMAARRATKPPKRSNHFFDALWRSRNKAESYERVKTLLFFKHELMVHYSILEELSLVEERIRAASASDPAVRAWLGKVGGLTGWNWRIIADTASRSFHSYGAAVDILPKKDDGLATYWLWSAEHDKEWWNIPYAKRRHPPEAVVSAFESQGFVWGGKWRLFDTMHFEYRPEILILNGLL
jgi:hypothetical protein